MYIYIYMFFEVWRRDLLKAQGFGKKMPPHLR